MNYEREEMITKVSMIGSVAISLAACAWFCVSQHKLVKNTDRLATVFEKLESKNRL